jgi:type II secretion system protein D
MNRSSSSRRSLRLPLALALVAGSAIALAPNALRADDPIDVPDGFDPAMVEAAFVMAQLDEQAPDEEPVASDLTKPASPDAVTPRLDERGRRIQADEPTVLAFRNVSVEQVIPFIVEATGKVVLPMPDVLSRRITLLNDQPLPRSRALDLVFLALQQNGIAVVESFDLIMLRDIAEIDRQDVPVLGPDESVLKRTDLGTIVEKVFALRHASAANLFEMLKDSKPSFAKMTADPESNQIVVMGNIGLLQRMERLITSLDQPAAASLATETFLLRNADASQVAQNIKDLFSQTTTGGNQNQNPFQNFFRPGQQNQQGRQGNNQGGNRGNNNQSSAQTSANLRVTPNAQQNSVTVLAEKQVLDQIREQITSNWDKPLPPQAAVPKVYDLKYTDPVKLKQYLTTLYGNPGGTNEAGQPAQNRNNQEQGANRLYGQFSFEAVPEASRLIVVAKSFENLDTITKIINEIDKPQTAGLPQIVELKHANAEELAEQLNALLAQEGTLAQITRSESGLSTSTSSQSPFASNQQTGTTNTNTNNQNQQNAAGSLRFWWQNARPPTATSGSSNLVSKLRIVPVWRQNALMVLSPPEYSSSIITLIESLDRPGRQVLLSAVIAEINVEDATALGLRWSNSPINPTFGDNAISATGVGNAPAITGTKNDLLPGLFDTSVLNTGININLLLQLLAQKTAVSILSEPRIFTSDNQEAEFFNGQDIPFITDSQTNQNGNLVQSFDYRAVGIALRVRPRITVQRDVDLRINLELSSVQPNQTLFGGFIVDRRETTTHLIVRDGQTVVVSGILRTQDSDIKRKVPLLGDIPLIGAVFTSTEKSKSKTELVAFITPFVISNPEEADSATKPDRERLGELREELRPAENLDRKKPEAKPAKPAVDDPGQRFPTRPEQPGDREPN